MRSLSLSSSRQCPEGSRRDESGGRGSCWVKSGATAGGRRRWQLGGYLGVLNLLNANLIGGLLSGKHKLRKSETPCYDLAVLAEERVREAFLNGTGLAVSIRAIVPRRLRGSGDAGSAEYGWRLCRQTGPILEVLTMGVLADSHRAELRLLSMGVRSRHGVDLGHRVLQGSVRVPV